MKEEEAYRQFLWKGLSQCTVLSESIWVMEPPRFEEAMNGIRICLFQQVSEDWFPICFVTSWTPLKTISRLAPEPAGCFWSFPFVL